MERCRVCLASSNLSNIFDSEDLAQHITAIACVDVLPDDGLPQYICLLCKHELDISINFKDKCESTFEMLKEQHTKEIQVKENIILNLLSGGSALDEHLPEETKKCILNSVKNDVQQNGGNISVEQQYKVSIDKRSHDLDMYKDCHNGKHMEIVTSTDDHESGSDNENDEQMIDLVAADIDISENVNFCLKCNFYFANEEGLVHHLERIHPTTMIQCEFCFMHFPNTQILKNHHLKSHSINDNKKIPLKCKVCVKTFRLQSELNVHLCSNPDQDFKCNKCGLGFKYEKDLNNHIKKAHTIAFSCNYCEKKFSLEAVLREHLKSHRKELVLKDQNDKMELQSKDNNAYLCMECNKIFAKLSNLMAHRKNHRGSKPHTCSICQMSFYKRNSLEKHLLEHVDLITCTKGETYVYDEEEESEIEEELTIETVTNS